MSLSIRVARNTIVQSFGKIASTVLGLFVLAIAARYLGLYGYGEYTTIVTYVTIFATLADFGLTLVTVQLINRPDIDKQKVLNNLFGFRLVSALLLLGFGAILSYALPYNPIIRFGIILASLSFAFVSFNQIFVGLFQTELDMGKVAIAEMVSRIVLLLGMLLVWKQDLGLSGMMIAMILSSAVNFSLHYLYSRKYLIISPAFDKLLWKKIIGSSWPLAITIFFNLIYLKADTLILSLIKTQNEVGIYGAAYRVIDVLITVPFMFAGIILPIITNSWLKSEKEFFSRVLQRSFDTMAIIIMPVVGGSLVVSEKLMTLVAGQEFTLAGDVLPILMLAGSGIYLGVTFSHAVIALDKQKNIIPAYVVVAITSLLGYLYFIPKYSYFGAAWMTVYSELAIALSSYYIVYKYAKFIPNLKILSKAVLASLIMVMILKYVSSFGWNAMIDILIGAVSYAVMMIMSKGVNLNEMKELLRLGER